VSFLRVSGLFCCLLLATAVLGSTTAAAKPQKPEDFALTVKPAAPKAHDPGTPYVLRVRNIRKWTATSVSACASVAPKQAKVVGVAGSGAVRFKGESACWIVRRIKPHHTVALRFQIRAKHGKKEKAVKVRASVTGGNSYAGGEGFKIHPAPPDRKKGKGKKTRRRQNPAAVMAQTCVTAQTLGVVFVTDDSGSMEVSDPIHLRSQAISVGLDQLPDGSLAAATAFSNYSTELFGVTVVSGATRPTLKKAAESLYDYGSTEYGAAFADAKEELDKMVGADRKAVVFLSDGVPTDGFEEATPVDLGGAPVYTIGLGVEGAEAASLLSHIAAGSGGQYYEALSAGQLQGIFGQILAGLTCNAQVVAETFALAPGASAPSPSPSPSTTGNSALWRRGARKTSPSPRSDRMGRR